MAKTLNLVVQDRCDLGNEVAFVVSYEILDGCSNPEQAMRDAAKEFIRSGTDESKAALAPANGCFNWGDMVNSVPDSLLEKHGLRPVYGESIDVFVDHNEVLTD